MNEVQRSTARNMRGGSATTRAAQFRRSSGTTTNLGSTIGIRPLAEAFAAESAEGVAHAVRCSFDNPTPGLRGLVEQISADCDNGEIDHWPLSSLIRSFERERNWSEFVHLVHPEQSPLSKFSNFCLYRTPNASNLATDSGIISG